MLTIKILNIFFVPLLNKKWYLLYVGHTSTLSGCKSLIAPRWKEAIMNGKGVAGDSKSEGSHMRQHRYLFGAGTETTIELKIES